MQLLQVVRNLIYLAKVIVKLTDVSESTEEVQVTLSWMIRKMCFTAKREVSETPDVSLRVRYAYIFIIYNFIIKLIYTISSIVIGLLEL